ncbi:MAG: hypothetical protein ACJ79A_12870 [Gemmatimonadaceae bacterium]
MYRTCLFCSSDLGHNEAVGHFPVGRHDGRTLTCRKASSPAIPGTTWWWFEVTGETQRYAAFRTEPTDTPENLRPRIAAHYAHLLTERARPATVRPRWSRPAPAAAPADPAR